MRAGHIKRSALDPVTEVRTRTRKDIVTMRTLCTPQVRARGMVQEVAHPRIPDLKLLGPVAKLSATPARIRSAPPELGEHTRDILLNTLGYSAEAIERLRQQGVI